MSIDEITEELQNTQIVEYTEPKLFETDEEYHTMISKVLREDQLEIVKECIKREKACLKIPTGGGKTRMSIMLCLYYSTKFGEPALVTCSKTILTQWIDEIRKLNETLSEDDIRIKYSVLHNDYCDLKKFKLKDIHILLTTHQVTLKVMKEEHLEPAVCQLLVVGFGQQMFYYNPKNPLIKRDHRDLRCIYSVRWSVFIDDEIQDHSNITTKATRSLIAICSDHRFLLSGTPFAEVKENIILGFLKVLGVEESIKSIPDLQNSMRFGKWKGYEQYLIERDEMKGFYLPDINIIPYEHSITDEEKRACESFGEIMKRFQEIADKHKLNGDVTNGRKYSSMALAMLGWYRVASVAPKLPIMNIAKSIEDDLENITESKETILQTFKDENLEEWVTNPDTTESSRIKVVKELVDKHHRIVIFSSFVITLELLEEYLEVETIRVSSKDSIPARSSKINDFSEESDEKKVLLLTFKLGSAGLNIQAGDCVIFLDQWWNDSTTSQAIARVYRQGNLRESVVVYILSSNLGIEEGIFLKQKAKNAQIIELRTGSIESKVPVLVMDECHQIRDSGTSSNLISKIRITSNGKVSNNSMNFAKMIANSIKK